MQVKFLFKITLPLYTGNYIFIQNIESIQCPEGVFHTMLHLPGY